MTIAGPTVRAVILGWSVPDAETDGSRGAPGARPAGVSARSAGRATCPAAGRRGAASGGRAGHAPRRGRGRRPLRGGRSRPGACRSITAPQAPRGVPRSSERGRDGLRDPRAAAEPGRPNRDRPRSEGHAHRLCEERLHGRRRLSRGQASDGTPATVTPSATTGSRGGTCALAGAAATSATTKATPATRNPPTARRF